VGRALLRWKEKGELHGEIILGQWFSFQDENGHGYCQPDILIVTSTLVFILECKLTFTLWAWPQLRELYKPVVEKTFERPSILVQVCRNLHYVPDGMIDSIQELMDSPMDGNNTWHFLT
jgi:hypothetical protein